MGSKKPYWIEGGGRKFRFATFEGALKAASAVFQKTGNIVGIQRDES
jgi:hypothetical protein